MVRRDHSQLVTEVDSGDLPWVQIKGALEGLHRATAQIEERRRVMRELVRERLALRSSDDPDDEVD